MRYGGELQATHDASRVLVVSAGGRPYGLPVRDVIEVLDNVTITPIPGVAPSVRGVVRYGRGVVAVVPLSRIVSSEDDGKPSRATVVVIRSSSTPMALEVDDALDVIDVAGWLRSDSCSRWSLGTVEHNDGLLRVVDARSVAEQLEDSGTVLS